MAAQDSVQRPREQLPRCSHLLLSMSLSLLGHTAEGVLASAGGGAGLGSHRQGTPPRLCDRGRELQLSTGASRVILAWAPREVDG